MTATKDFSSERFRELIDTWEASVRATHHFLSERHIAEFRAILESSDFSGLKFCVVETRQTIAGFMAIAGNKLEMLFIHPEFAGRGFGSLLMQKALAAGVTHIDVNEQNPNAVRFYLKHDFEIASRSELDDFGNEFPILHLVKKP